MYFTTSVYLFPAFDSGPHQSGLTHRSSRKIAASLMDAVWCVVHCQDRERQADSGWRVLGLRLLW